MSRIRALLLATLAALVPLADVFGATVFIHDFSRNPLDSHGNDPVFVVRGDADGAFAHDPDSAPRLRGDRPGSLTVTYDSLQPTTRLMAPLAGSCGPIDDFVVGAVLTIRPGIDADPFGFHPIAFGLLNETTTGDDRTGDIDDFRADTFDTFEMAYFPNVSPQFGGPFLSATAFGMPLGEDAFSHFTFGSVPAGLAAGVTYLVQLEHRAADHTLTLRVWSAGLQGQLIERLDARVVVSLSGLQGFDLASVGIFAYHDGFNLFASSGRSLLATVDYDLLYAATLEDGHLPQQIATVLGRLGLGASRRVPILEQPPQ
ncbi:MAG: hypothetical protein ACREAA_03595 [Candidatus Polarisedimenticolia bacterium]